MPKKRFSAEQIVTLLRQIEVAMGQRYKPEEVAAKLQWIDVLVSKGQSMADAIPRRSVRSLW